MAINYTDIKLTSQQPVFNSGTTWSGNVLTRPTGIQWFEAKVDYVITNPQEDMPAFMANFTLWQTQASSWGLGFLQKPLSVSVTTAAAFNAGTTVISASNASALNVGQFIQFNNHNKLYQVTAKSASNFTVFPSLRKYIPNGTALVITPRIKGIIMDDKITFDHGLVVKASFNVREQW